MFDNKNFIKKFNTFTRYQLLYLNWTNCIMAGESVVYCLLNEFKSDQVVCLYLYNINSHEINKKLSHICSCISKVIPFELKLYKKDNYYSIISDPHYREIRIYYTNYKSVEDVINSFGIDCCCIGYANGELYITDKSKNSIINKVNTFNPDCIELLEKFANIGFTTKVSEEYLQQDIRKYLKDDTKTVLDRTLLEKAILFNDIETITKNKSDILKTENIYRILFEHSSDEIIKLFIDNYTIHEDTPDNYGLLAIHYCIIYNRFVIFKQIHTKHKLKLHKKYRSNYSIFDICNRYMKNEFICYLLTDNHIHTSHKTCFLQKSIELCNYSIIPVLLKHGYNGECLTNCDISNMKYMLLNTIKNKNINTLSRVLELVMLDYSNLYKSLSELIIQYPNISTINHIINNTPQHISKSLFTIIYNKIPTNEDNDLLKNIKILLQYKFNLDDRIENVKHINKQIIYQNIDDINIFEEFMRDNKLTDNEFMDNLAMLFNNKFKVCIEYLVRENKYRDLMLKYRDEFMNMLLTDEYLDMFIDLIQDVNFKKDYINSSENIFDNTKQFHNMIINSVKNGSYCTTYFLLRYFNQTFNIECVDTDNNTLLHILCSNTSQIDPDIDITYFHLINKLSPGLINKLNNNGESALHLAVKTDKLLLAQILLENGADITIYTRQGYNVIHYGVITDKKNIKMIELLLRHQYELINILTKYDKMTPIMLAVKFSNMDVAKYLLKRGANTDITDIYCNNLIHYVCINSDYDMLKLLSLISTENCYGKVALDYINDRLKSCIRQECTMDTIDDLYNMRNLLLNIRRESHITIEDINMSIGYKLKIFYD